MHVQSWCLCWEADLFQELIGFRLVKWQNPGLLPDSTSISNGEVIKDLRKMSQAQPLASTCTSTNKHTSTINQQSTSHPTNKPNSQPANQSASQKYQSIKSL